MSNLIVEKGSHDLSITINRPESSNALSLTLIEELLKVLSDYEDNHEIKSVVITGKLEAIASAIVNPIPSKREG